MAEEVPDESQETLQAIVTELNEIEKHARTVNGLLQSIPRPPESPPGQYQLKLPTGSEDYIVGGRPGEVAASFTLPDGRKCHIQVWEYSPKP